MLKWTEIEQDKYSFSPRRTWKAKASDYLDLPDVSDISKLGESNNRVWMDPYSFWLTELIRSPHDDDPYRYLLIVNHQKHYYVRTIEDGKEVAEKIYAKLKEFYKNC